MTNVLNSFIVAWLDIPADIRSVVYKQAWFLHRRDLIKHHLLSKAPIRSTRYGGSINLTISAVAGNKTLYIDNVCGVKTSLLYTPASNVKVRIMENSGEVHLVIHTQRMTMMQEDFIFSCWG